MIRLRPLCILALAACLLVACAPTGLGTDEMISQSGLKNETVVKHLQKYGKRTSYSKAFAVDPMGMDKSWAFWNFRNKIQLLEFVAKKENYALFAIGTEYVWPEYRAQYMASPKGRARLCMRQCKYREAIALFEEMMADGGHQAYGYGSIGWCHYHLGELEQAAAAFNKSLEAEPKENFSILMVAQCALESGNAPEARRILDAVSKRDRKTFGSEYAYRDAIYYAFLGDYVSAAAKKSKRLRLGICEHAVDRGVELTCVIPNCPAALAGLQKGDCIVKFNGRSTVGLDFNEEFSDMLQKVETGDAADVEFTRGGKAYTTRVICGITPDILERYAKLKGVEPVGE